MPSNLKTDDKGQVKKGPGRPKGSPNKINKAAKDAIADAAEALGGSDRLVEWVKEDPANEKAFWTTIYPKLVPVTLGGDADNPLTVVTKIEQVIIDSSKG
jgi:hypothetical protein